MSFEKYISENDVLKAAREFLRSLSGVKSLMVAVSGGSDSTGLLLAFHDVLQEPEFAQFSLRAATVDHQLRDESKTEALGVQALCSSLQIPHVIKTWDGAKPKSGLSAASRRVRYHLLVQAASEFGADVIFLGHTMGDQLETVKMRQMRCADSDNIGLAGMAEAVLVNRVIWACRPFLSINRQEIRDYLMSIGHGWFDDPSNDSDKYERVRVRKALGKEHFEFNDSASEARAVLAEQAALWFETAVTMVTPFVACVKREMIVTQPNVARYALSYLSAILGGKAFGLSSQQAATLLEKAVSGVNTRFTANRCVFDFRKDRLFIYREARSLPTKVSSVNTPVLWDERLWLLPGEGEILDIAALIGPSLPASIRKTMAATLPFEAGSRVDARIVPALRPFDDFLPSFDLPFAMVVNAAFGRNPYPALPIQRNSSPPVEKTERF